MEDEDSPVSVEVRDPDQIGPTAAIDVRNSETNDLPSPGKTSIGDVAVRWMDGVMEASARRITARSGSTRAFRSTNRPDDNRTVWQLMMTELCKSNTVTLVVLVLIFAVVMLEQSGNGSAGFAIFVSFFFVAEISIRFWCLGFKRFTRDKFCVMDGVITLVDVIVSFPFSS
jgi:hypothetical protein